jgi:hypothetical protein
MESFFVFTSEFRLVFIISIKFFSHTPCFWIVIVSQMRTDVHAYKPLPSFQTEMLALKALLFQ